MSISDDAKSLRSSNEQGSSAQLCTTSLTLRLQFKLYQINQIYQIIPVFNCVVTNKIGLDWKRRNITYPLLFGKNKKNQFNSKLCVI